MPATFRGILGEHAAANQSLPRRRVWDEQRIRALAEDIVRRIGHEAPMVASAFDLARIRDWAAEIVELCERHGGQDAKEVEEIHDASAHGSMAAHHVEILRARVKELEALVDERGKAVTDAHVANHAMHQDLSFALQLGDAMREAMRTGEWRAGHDRSMANSAVSGWDRFKPGLAKAPSVPVGASEAPREGGDSDRRRLEALERYLEGDTFREVWKTSMGPFAAGTKFEGQHFGAPTLAALADKLAEKEGKP